MKKIQTKPGGEGTQTNSQPAPSRPQRPSGTGKPKK